MTKMKIKSDRETKEHTDNHPVIFVGHREKKHRVRTMTHSVGNYFASYSNCGIVASNSNTEPDLFF